MQISALGHSCVLLDFEDEDRVTSLLIDPWLSDHAVGDAMGRFPRLRFETAALGAIDAVYLTHAHSDHLDPYTLTRLWNELDNPPVLILPVSLAFLVPVFERFLDGVEILLLHPHEPTVFKGVELVGLFDVGSEPTNEDDVMVLVVTHGEERVLVEADARLSLEFPTFRAYISSLLCAPGIRSAVYLTTENELTGTLDSGKCDSLEQRQGLAEMAMDEMLASVVELYAPAEEPDDDFLFEDPPTDLWQAAHVLRLIHGQGLTSWDHSSEWKRILFPVRIADRVRSERAIAEANGCAHTIDALVVGQVHTIVDGKVVGHRPMEGFELLDHEEERVFDPELPFFPQIPCAQVRTDRRHPNPHDPGRYQREGDPLQRIGELLNTRFLPFLFAARTPPVLHLLSANGGAYRVRVFTGAVEELGLARDFVLGFGAWGFVEQAVTAGSPEPDEAYWADDLEDFLNGRIDEFTTFARLQLPTSDMRLWACLATPLFNADLVVKRVTLHFERAGEGYTPESWLVPIYMDVVGA